MTARNCIVPLIVRLRGIPGDERLSEASNAIARCVAGRLAEAGRVIAAREGWTAWRRVYAAPEIRFSGAALDDDLQQRIAASVVDGLGRAVTGRPAALAARSASPQFVLADYPFPGKKAVPARRGGVAIATSNDLQALAVVLQMLDSLPDGDERRGAISFLVGLALKKGSARKQAVPRLYQLLAGVPNKNIEDHSAAVSALIAWADTEVGAYDLLLYGRAWFADRSKQEIGSGLVVGAFRNWLHQAGGRGTIQFLRSRIEGGDRFKANLAARIVADLLEGEADPSERKYRSNYAALRAMARGAGWESFGPLRVASATARIFPALATLRQQAEALRSMVLRGPLGDPYDDKDVELLQGVIDSLSRTGVLRERTPTGRLMLVFTAENRQETEHELLGQDPASTGEWLEEMAEAYTIAVDAGAGLQERTEVLHAGVRAIDQFLGSEAARSSDQRAAMFEVRHHYIEAWLWVFGQSFGAGGEAVAATYQGRLDQQEYEFEHLDVSIARRRFVTAREQFQKYFRWWNDGNSKYPGNDRLDESFFFVMRRVLAGEGDVLSTGFSTGWSGHALGGFLTIPPSEARIPTDTREVTRLALQTSIFGLQAALFLLYATNLSIHNMLIKSDVGSQSFQDEQGKRLSSMRAEMEQTWNSGDYDAFLKKTDAYEQTLQNVVEKIKDRAKLDFLLNLAITLIAALLTEGAALAVRMAALSETIALARTARAISSVHTLFEVGVFTAAELSLQKVFFNKPIGLGDVAKEAATNLVFLGALKGVGKFTERFAVNSVVGKLVVGHLVGFSGVAAVSATLTRVETGQWPQDVALFLAQTATTYLLIAGLHATFDGLVAKPALSGLARGRLEGLKSANEALFQSYHERVNAGSLSPAEFEAMKAERIRLLEETRSIAQVLRDAGVISEADMASITAMADDAVDQAKGARFVLPRLLTAGQAVLALPAPESVSELSHVGDSNIYVYDPARPHPAVDAMLARYKDKGFTVQGTAELMALVDPAGRTHFLLSAVPLPPTRLLGLPAATAAPQVAGSALARASGLSEAQLSSIREALAKINRDAEKKLAAEYPDHTVVATLAMLVEQISVITAGWKADAVRGLADALSLERGIPRSAVRRLFQSVDPAALPQAFETFHSIVNSPKVAAGSDALIGDDLLPRDTLRLIDAYRTLQRRGLELPAEMDQRALRGLLQQIDKLPDSWASWLATIPKADRARALGQASGLPESRAKVPENVSATLAVIRQDIPGQPGLNPLAGANGEAFVQSLETRAGGKITDPSARSQLVIKADHLRFDVGLLEAGTLDRTRWEDLIDRANEIRKTALGHLALSLPPRPAPLLTPRGDLTQAGLAFIRKRFGGQRTWMGSVEDLNDNQLNQLFSHESKWLEEAIRQEVLSEWAEMQREAARRGTPLDPRTDFAILEGRAFNALAGRLQEAARFTGATVDTSVLGENTGAFIDALLQANDPVLKPAYDLCEKLAQEARERRAVEPPGRGKRAPDFADHWSEFLRDFRRGTNGAKRPDIIEVMLSTNQIVVTDPSLAYSDPTHNFKSAVYRAIIERLIKGVQVGATDIRALLRQTPVGP